VFGQAAIGSIFYAKKVNSILYERTSLYCFQKRFWTQFLIFIRYPEPEQMI